MTVQDFFQFSLSRIAAANSNLLKKSDVFCMSPWIQLHAQTDGSIAPCCMSSIQNGNELGNLKQNPKLHDAWNSPKMKQLRLNMLQGKKSSICNNCYAHEQIGKKSERMQYNYDYRHYYFRVLNTGKDGTVYNNAVPVVDVRFSNKCNYKCRICNSDYSSLWYEDEVKLGKASFGGDKEKQSAGNEDEFWKSFKEMLPGVRRLHFAGGEPLFMDQHYEVLEHLIQTGHTNLTLSYNTNFSTLKYKRYDVINLWNRFKQVDVWASLDGMGERGDYQRKGQKWQTIEKNIHTLQSSCHTVNFGVNITVSIFNVLHVAHFVKYLIESGFVEIERINLYPLYYPHHFVVTNLTDGLKQKAEQSLKNFEQEFLAGKPNTATLKNHINALTKLMFSEKGDKIPEFQKNISAVDFIRNETFAVIFPELSELMTYK